MPLVLYYYPLSQPSRAVHALLLLGRVEFIPKVIDVSQGDSETEEYTNLFPTQFVPGITDDDFALFESHTIMKYIVRTRNLHQFFPQDSKQQALIETYLDWHHTGTRRITFYLRDFVWGPFFMKRPPPPNGEERKKEIEDILTFVEKIFLGDGKYQYIQNQPNLTIADLSLINELVGLFSLNYDFNQHPVLKKYIEHLLSIPEIRESNKGYLEFEGYIKQGEPNDFIKQYI